MPKLRPPASLISPAPTFVHYILKQDRQSTHNVTLSHVHATIVAVDKRYLLHILSVYV